MAEEKCLIRVHDAYMCSSESFIISNHSNLPTTRIVPQLSIVGAEGRVSHLRVGLDGLQHKSCAVHVPCSVHKLVI